MEEYTPKIVEPISAEEIASQEKLRQADIRARKENKPVSSATETKELSTEDKPLALIGTPYLVDYYDLGNLYQDNIDGLKDKAQLVDAYLKTQVLEKNWQPTIKSYKKVLSELEKEYNLTDEMSNFNKIDFIYLNLKERLK